MLVDRHTLSSFSPLLRELRSAETNRRDQPSKPAFETNLSNTMTGLGGPCGLPWVLWQLRLVELDHW
jgi:hypothetical protein